MRLVLKFTSTSCSRKYFLLHVQTPIRLVRFMLEIQHQIALVVAINGLIIATLIRHRKDYKRVTVMGACMGIVCYCMDAIDRQRWFTTPILILGICVPFILIIGISVILLYYQVVTKMKLLHRLRKKFS